MTRDSPPDWDSVWPQRRERRPSFVDPYYLHYSALAASLVRARDAYLGAELRVLDVGCGDMPYYPLFAGLATDYVGTDVEPGPNVRYVCPLEELTIPDESFDLVLCTQVLEHVVDPERSLAEIARVLAPGGYAFVSTHGIWPFHPYPADRWRWTQQGLEQLVSATDGIELVELVPHRATASTLALLVGYYVDVVTRRKVLLPVRWVTIAALNTVGLLGDRIDRLRFPHNDTLIHNYLAICRRPESRVA